MPREINLNGGLRANNTSGVPGVRLKNGRYEAYFKRNYKGIHVGRFNTIEEATEARTKAILAYDQ